ncbi:hypothetical protein JR316_0000023 [Psilocybe cubensis]|uniref:Uncharacterized protein n=1 Tax=Psilocybe cubensis TaxID=181762 RepID=A0ACB8HE78_PSICU|nr:hypothetical protein JR316_0000023 [Psilocybe cubensis]KAH9485962.1 hypothetical protein JR316_0000023 [Psilocybe cubensis]
MDDASMENLSLPGAFNSSPTEQMDITSSDDVTRNHPGPSQTPQSPTEQMDITSSDDDARNHPGPSQTPQLQSQILKPQESGKRKRSDHEEISSRKLIAVEPEYLQELEFAVDELTKKLKSKDKEIKRLQSIEPSVNDLKDAEIRHLRVVEQKVETLIIGKIYISKEKSASDGAYKTLQSQFEDYKRVRFPGFMLSYLRLSIEQDVDRQHKEASRAKEHEMSELEAKFKQQIEELQIHYDRTVEELNKKVESQSLQISSLVEDSLEESETAKILLNEPDGEGSNILEEDTSHIKELEDSNMAFTERITAYEAQIAKLNADLEEQKAESSKLTRAVQELEGQSVDGISKQERITELEALVRAKTTELEELKHSTSHAQDLENRINELQARLGEFEREREGQSIDGISKQERITELEALVRAKTTELEELKHSTSHAQDLENRINELQARLQESDSEREKLIQAQQSSSHRENVLASELQTVREKRSEQIKTLTAQVRLLENELSGNQTALKDQGQELERLRAASTQRRTADEAEIAKLNADLKDQKAESSRLTRAVQELEGQLTDGIDRENRIVQLNNDLDAKTAELKKSREESTSHAQQLENRIGDLQARLQESDSKREKLIQAQQLSSHRENVFASELQTVREKRSEQIKTLNARVRDLEKELEQAATNSRDSLSKERERYQQMSVEFQKQQAALSQTTEDLSTVKAALEKEFEDHGNTKSLLELLQSDLVDSQKAISILNSQLEATMADHIEFGEEAQDSDSAMDPDAPESTPSATGKSQKAAGKRRQMSMMPDTTLYTLMNHRNGDLQVNMEPENSAERPTFSNFFNQTEFTPTLSTSANRSSPVRDGDLASSSNPGPSIPNRFSKPGHYRRGRATHQSPPPPSSAIPRSGRDDVRGVEASTAFHADTPATVADPSVVPPHSVFSSTPPVTPVPPVASVSAAERAFQERILNTLSTLSSDVRGVVSDVQELRSNANTQPATPRRRIPNRKPYSPYKQAGPNASRQLQQYLLGISEDDDIFIMDSIHIASPAEVDKFENSLRDPPPLEPLQLHFDQVKVKWNAYLADLFAEQFLRLHSNLNATADQIKEHFMARVQMFREKLISIVPRPGETSEQCFDRVREERLNANRRKRRRTRQRNKLYVDRYSNCIDAGRHDIADVVLTLGEDGMSEDETDGEDSTVVLLTQWRNPKLLTPLKIADSLRPATSVNGTRRPGSRPLKRRRLQSAREGYQPAPDQRPENYYYSSWRACLSRYDIALLKMKDAKPFFGE